MITFLKFVRGYVIIKVWGFSPERFLNLCSNKGILVWNIYQNDAAYYMAISLKSFYKLRPIVKKTGTRVAIIKRCGLPFLIPKLLKRKAFILGLVGCLLFWILSQQYVWKIEIQGNYQISEDVFMDFLELEGIEIGQNKNKISVADLEKISRQEFSVITWISAKLDGTTLKIDIKENTVLSISNNETVEEGKDIISDFDGIVFSMIVRKGVPQISIGQEIKAGELLVSGNIPIIGEDGTAINYQIVDADADIFVQYSQSYQSSLLKSYEEKIYTGNEISVKYILVNLNRYCIGSKKSSFELEDCVIEQKPVLIFEFLNIPISIETHTYKEYYIQEAIYEKQEGAKVLLDELNLYLKSFIEKGVQIIEKNVRIEETSTQWLFVGELILVGPCGLQIELEPMEINTPIDVEEIVTTIND